MKFPQIVPRRQSRTSETNPTPGKSGNVLTRNKKKVITLLGAATIGLSVPPHMQRTQENVDDRHGFLNAEFTLDELSKEQMSRQIIFTTLYPNIPFSHFNVRNRSQVIPGVRDLVKRVPMTGGILLRSPDMGSLAEIRETNAWIRSENPTAIIAVDFEGGYIRFPAISEELRKKYAFPEAIWNIKELEMQTYSKNPESGKISPFPSAEFLGIEYEKLRTDAERENFTKMMREYGFSVATMLADHGVNLILGPSFDTAEAIGSADETPLAKSDRAYSKNPRTVSVLGNSFVRGVRLVPGIGAVAKHFVGTGFTSANTDITEGKAKKMTSAILPFRDFINDFEAMGYTQDQVIEKIAQLSPGGKEYETMVAGHQRKIEVIAAGIKTIEKELVNAETKYRTTKTKKEKKPLQAQIAVYRSEKAEQEKRLAAAKSLMISEKSRITMKAATLESQKSPYEFNTPMVMSGNHSNDFYETDMPGVFSKKTITALREQVGTMKHGELGGMGKNGIIITDDLMAGAPIQHSEKSTDQQAAEKTATMRALHAGNDILLYGDTDINSVVEEFTMPAGDTHLRDKARRVLDLKVDLGILTRDARGRYGVSPKLWNVTSALVKQDGLYSHQWPWLLDEKYYQNEGGKIGHISLSNTLLNATKNLVLNQCRIDPGMLEVACRMHPGIYETYEAPHESMLRKKLIVVDKSAQKLRVYDLETRAFIEEFSIGIGKGTSVLSPLEDKRIAGDYKTPSGYYQVVQKKDPKLIKKTIEPELYREYGGDGGAMLVLGGSWTPQIAIHGTLKEATGPVSHGCVRTTNEIANHLMNTVKLGSVVIITR